MKYFHFFQIKNKIFLNVNLLFFFLPPFLEKPQLTRTRVGRFSRQQNLGRVNAQMV